MKITWGEPKRIANFHKHGLDFEDVIDFDWDRAVIDVVHSMRMKAVGYDKDGTAVVIFATLGTEAISIIRFRPANARERRRLYEH